MAAMMGATSLFFLVLCMLSQVAGQMRRCGVGAPPHPRGICGEALTRTRNNLCILLYDDENFRCQIYRYAQGCPLHRGKRSADALAALDALPLSAFTPAEFQDQDDAAPAQPEAGNPLLALPMRTGSWTFTSALLAQKRSGMDVSKRSGVGITCECCQNMCRPSQLARYC